jgi:ParB-like nuclease domain
MVWNLLTYVAVCAIPVVVFWFAGRLIGLNQPFSGPTGHAWLDAEDAFDRARRQHQRHRLVALLRRQPHRLDLPTLEATATLGLVGPRHPTELVIPIGDIVGTADGAAGKFDRDFLPTDERSRPRFQALVTALRQGQTLPPIEVYRLHGRYYVSDGHHRVAAARALGETFISAYVTEILG